MSDMDVFFENYKNTYETILPVFNRYKSKYWEPDKIHAKWHRFDGPAIITAPTITALRSTRSVSWYLNDDLYEETDIKRWCERNNADEEDLSEVEALIMWSELS